MADHGLSRSGRTARWSGPEIDEDDQRSSWRWPVSASGAATISTARSRSYRRFSVQPRGTIPKMPDQPCGDATAPHLARTSILDGGGWHLEIAPASATRPRTNIHGRMTKLYRADACELRVTWAT